jgi:proline iminopeptidase
MSTSVRERASRPAASQRWTSPIWWRRAGAPSSSDAPSASSLATAVLLRMWRDRRLGLGFAAIGGLVTGALVGLWIPRGPMTSGEALLSMLVSLVLGGIAGLVMRSRWAMLLAPLAFIAAYELTRVQSDGPTVDGIHLGSTYGIMAFVVGRFIHGLIALVPMMLGAVGGAALARGREPIAGAHILRSKVGLYIRRTVAVVASAAMIALAARLARPASTSAVHDAEGNKVPGSIAELIRVEIGGHDLSMMIRGTSTDNPILLFLAGGPGGSEVGAMRKHLASLEQDFLVVTWDQRGTGKSADQIEPTATLTFDNAIKDTIEVTNYLRSRFGQDKVYLVGQSYGSTLGVRAVQQRPELFAAFVGVGQMVSQRETDTIFYDDTLAWAIKTGDNDLAKRLTDIGPPPYSNLFNYEPVLSYEHEVYPYDHRLNAEGEGGFSENIFEPEYSLIQQVHNLGAFLDTFSIIYPQLQEIDFRADASQLDIPVYLVMGAHEAPGRADPAREWFAMLEAPRKELVVFNTSGHRPLFEQPDEFQQFMTDTVLAETSS